MVSLVPVLLSRCFCLVLEVMTGDTAATGIISRGEGGEANRYGKQHESHHSLRLPVRRDRGELNVHLPGRHLIL